MALSPLSWVALVALVAPLGTLVASQRQMCHLPPPLETVPSGGVDEPGAMTVTNGGPWGHWGDTEFCPRGSFAVGIQLKVQQYQGFFRDDTGMNGVRLLCDTGTDTVTSSVGPFGLWQAKLFCPAGQRLVSFQLMVEPSQGMWDDTAANNAAVLCSGDTARRRAGGLAQGSWGSWSPRCDPPCGVCGVRTRVEHQHSSDASGLNDVKMYCCTH